MTILLKRAYEAPARSDGVRILVDRLWPRGVPKTGIDLWLKDVAPSTALRQWFAHDPDRWAEFKERYRVELQDNPALDELRALVAGSDVTLLYGARDETHNQAVVLKEILDGGP